MAIGTGLSKWGDGGVDEAGIEAFEPGVPQSQLVQRARRKAFHQDVAVLSQTLQHGRPGGVGDVQRNALLAGVQIEKRGALLWVRHRNISGLAVDRVDFAESGRLVCFKKNTKSGMLLQLAAAGVLPLS